MSISHISISYQSHTNHCATIAAAFPFVCRLLWFYLSIKRFGLVQYVGLFRSRFPLVHASRFLLFDVLSASTIRTIEAAYKCIAPVRPVFSHRKFRHVAKNIEDQVRPVQNFTFGYDFRYIFFGMATIHHQIPRLIFRFLWQKVNLFNFSSSYKSFRIRSFHFFAKSVSPLGRGKSQNSNSSRYSFSFFSLILGYDTYNSCFSNLILVF
jgi:hypothetical protein